MQIFRAYIAPFLILLVFLVAMLAVSARIFLPNDMMAPAPIEEVEVSLSHHVIPHSGPTAAVPEPFMADPISLTSLM